MCTQPKRSGLGDKDVGTAASVLHAFYRELCQDEDGNRYSVVVFRTHPGFNITDYELEDETPVRFIDDCLFEIESTGKELTRCP